MRSLVAVVTVASLATPSLAVANDLASSVAKAAAHLAAVEVQAPTNAKNELLVPGLAVLGAGTLIFLYGLVHETGVECTTNVAALSANCGTTRSTAVIITGAAVMGAGGFLIWKGNRDRRALPQIQLSPGHLSLRQHIRW